MRELGCILMLLLGTVACYEPDLSKTHYRCLNDGRNECPTGSACRPVCGDNYCYPYAADLAAELCSTTDNGTGPGDLAFPSPDLAAAGCRSGIGYDVGGGAFACPGSWNPAMGKYPASLCADTHTVCNAGATSINNTLCQRLSGFYLSDVIGSYKAGGSASAARCDAGEINRIVYGCGSFAQSLITSARCNTLSQYYDCSFPTSSFRCPLLPFSTLQNTTNPKDTDGVLCCPK